MSLEEIFLHLTTTDSADAAHEPPAASAPPEGGVQGEVTA
jgi:hypothetical protein